MTIEEQFGSIASEFRRVGANLTLTDDRLKIRVRAPHSAAYFRIPELVEANHRRVPGWFLADIWDYMGLTHLNEFPDSMHLQGWGFSTNADGNWVKGLPPDGNNWLVYSPQGARLYVQNNIMGSRTDASTFPIKTIFHAQKVFEENGWFGSGEMPLHPLDLNDYLVQQ